MLPTAHAVLTPALPLPVMNWRRIRTTGSSTGAMPETALDTARLVLKTPRRESVAVRTRMAPLLPAVTAALKCVCGHFSFLAFLAIRGLDLVSM